MGAILVFILLAWLLGLPVRVSGSDADSLAQRKVLIDVFKSALGLAAGLGAVVALALNYRRHRIEESQSHRDDQRLLTERFGSAAEQLGHEQPAVRLAGVHALARLADDWEDQRQMCIDVLCAYLRLPPTLMDALANSGDLEAGGEPRSITPRAELEVRQTIVRLIADHLRRRRKASNRISWRGCDFDFTGALFDGNFSFERASFVGSIVSFDAATFSGGTVSFKAASFFSGGVGFDAATFSGGTVSFEDATFSGGNTNFSRATFSGGNVDFTNAKFSGGTVPFIGATFSGGTVLFQLATFSDGMVLFDEATFAGGAVSFEYSTFSGGEVHFDEATFCGTGVDFERSTFSGSIIHFDKSTFSGSAVNFEHATFSDGTMDFEGATFSGGIVNFATAEFAGGGVRFPAPADWSRPPIFDAWERQPAEVVLP